MRPPYSVTCPVCGRSNRAQDQCSFCGANLQAASPALPAEPPGSVPLPPPADPGSGPATGMGQPPWAAGPTSQWQGPALAPKYAGFWIRAVAYSLDGFILLILLFLFIGVGIFGYTSGSETDTLTGFSYAFYETHWNFLNLGGFILNMAYFTFFLGTRGQTPGKMICGLKVIRIDGNPIRFGQAALRTLGYYLNHFTLCIGFLWVAFDSRKQGLHDKIAGTVEIRVGLAEIQGWQPPPPSYGPTTGA